MNARTPPPITPPEVKLATPSLPNSSTLNQLLHQLTADDIDEILLLEDFSKVRDSAGPTLSSLRLKLIEYAEKQLKVPKLLEQIYALNAAAYVRILGAASGGSASAPTSPPRRTRLFSAATPPP